MAKPCFPVSSLSYFLCCVFLSDFFVNSLVSLPFPPRPDQIEILLAFKNEFPITKCNFNEWPYSKPVTKSWTNKNVTSFDGVGFDNKIGVVTKLDLHGACLSGSLNANSSLFRFHHLRYLDLSFNHFGSSSFLAELGKLTNLEVLDLSSMDLVGEIPPSIGNLSRLTNLDLSNNKLTGSFLPNLPKLSFLYLSYNHFSGIIPCSLLNMSFLAHLDLSQNHLSDYLETLNCSSSSKLEWLDLSYNFFSGEILEPISKLSNLKHFDLSFQNSTYPINFVSLGFKSLESMYLSGNSISRLATDSPNLRQLVLYNCSINEFPTFIKNLKNLDVLYISHNRLKGQVPEWLWNLPYLRGLILSHNSLTGFEGSPKMLLNSSPGSLDLRSNAFRGSLPIIPPRLLFMFASNNNFSGEIPVSLCNQSSLGVLDLSDNNFSGSIPGCLSKSVEDLNLRNNNLIGSLPDIFDNNGSLVTLDVGHNQITGKLPSSLAKCKHLEILNMEGNRISDTFPFWLKDLPRLKVIVLRSNRFHGPIYSPQQPLSFPELRIIDISRNNFNGSLPPNYFVNWSTRHVSITEEDEMYMGDTYNYEYNPSMYLRNKGLNMELEKILVTYTAIDFSRNKLQGQIPESIGLLKSLIVLNLPNNGFNGHIPSSLAKLTKLESLDLSRNQLSGKIPQELATLSFLEYIDISHNKISGQIPQCTQFGGQPKSSFEGNINLCGLPLRESCFKGTNVPSTQHPKPPKKEQVLNWKAAAIGYGPGVLFGLVLFFKLFRL